MNKLVITRLEGTLLTALLSDGKVVELNLEEEDSVLGNIYVAKVKNVVKNINAAFVDFAPDRTGYYSLLENPVSLFARPRSGTVREGDEIIVQVAKDAIKTKDPVLTANLNFTGTYAVVTAQKNVIGFSSKITDKAWKESLKPELELLTERKAGVIIRTNAYKADRAAILSEVEYLLSLSEKIKADAAYRTCYTCLHRAEPGYMKTLMGCLESQIESIVTDDPDVFENLRSYLTALRPKDLSKLKRYEDQLVSLSKLYALETVMEQATQKRVWLKSGGYLVIEPTEAMVVIDVNTGKYSGKKSLDETILKINLEAAGEIAAQLRLRNLSGIIIVDFIDMNFQEHKELLLERLKQDTASDPVKTSVVDMTSLNLVEMTRKKERRSLAEQLKFHKTQDKGMEP